MKMFFGSVACIAIAAGLSLSVMANPVLIKPETCVNGALNQATANQPTAGQSTIVLETAQAETKVFFVISTELSAAAKRSMIDGRGRWKFSVCTREGSAVAAVGPALR